jgi:uncharacterized protein
MASPKPFPTEGPILPEERQIGRTRAIDDLQRRLTEDRQHTLLLQPRRIGKTSVARAALARIREDQGWALEIDLSESRYSAAEPALAGALADLARIAGVRVEGHIATSKRLLAKAAKVFQPLSSSAKAAAQALGADEDLVSIATAVDDVLGSVDPERPADMSQVLAALDLAANTSDKPIVILLDECQRMQGWQRAQQDLDTAMQRGDSDLVLLFAGSEQSALEKLFAKGQPLHRDGLRFELPDIAYDDWQEGLAQRFSEVGLTIGSEEIDQILAASGGHPQKTMQVCAHAQNWATDVGAAEIDGLLVGNAVKSARKQPSWDS